MIGDHRGDHRYPAGAPKVGIVGVGLVGATIAYSLLLQGPHCELVLVDVNREKAEGDAMDLNHGIPLAAPISIRAGDYADLRDAAVVVVAAGVAQRPGETRLDLLHRNARIMSDVTGHIMEHAPGAIIVVVTNPVDVLSYVAYKRSGLPAERVIGSGTLLDTMRLRYLLGEYFACDPRSVHAYVIGEHGDSEIPVWSLANIGGVRLGELGPRWKREEVSQALDRIFRDVRGAAYEIIRRKGATYYGVSLAVRRLLECILQDQHSVLTVSTHLNGWKGVEDVYIGVPCVVGRTGIERIVDIPLTEEEVAAFRRSAATIREAIGSMEAMRVSEPAPAPPPGL